MGGAEYGQLENGGWFFSHDNKGHWSKQSPPQFINDDDHSRRVVLDPASRSEWAGSFASMVPTGIVGKILQHGA
jgi:hypothetical protein